MADDQHDHKVSPGQPPLHTRSRKGQSNNPRGRSSKKLHALLAARSASPPLGPDLGGAREHAYTAVDRIESPEGFCRRDIAAPR
jgi:hypothetical protein